jgi:hypothetical protein
MSGAILPLPQHAFMAWCSVKKKHGDFLLLYLTKHHAMKTYGVVVLHLLNFGIRWR